MCSHTCQVGLCLGLCASCTSLMVTFLGREAMQRATQHYMFIHHGFLISIIFVFIMYLKLAFPLKYFKSCFIICHLLSLLHSSTAS